MTQPAPPAVPRMNLFSTLSRFLGDIFYLPRFHKLFLTLALLAAGGGYLYEFNNPPAPPTSSGINAPSVTAATRVPPPHNKLLATLSPYARRIGISILLGFVAGWLFRAFTKTMALLAILFFGLLALLNYFHVPDAQLQSAATQDYRRATTWLTAHATEIKDQYLPHIPSAAAGFVGMFVGARKRR